MAHGETTQIPDAKKSIVEIRYLSEEEKIRLQAEYREKMLHDEASALSGARMEGRAEERQAIAIKMRNQGFSEEQIKAVLDE